MRERAALVTGAAGGIGQALCAQLVADGWRVALLDVDAEAVAAVAEALGDRALGLACDVTDAEGSRGAVASAIDALGDLDLVICNAGITHRSLAAETSDAVLRRVMDVNFFGAVHVAQAALPSVRRRRGGLVAVSSVAGFAPLVGRAGYAASKHALHGYFDSLRAELRGDGVDVLVVCPSFVATGIDDHALAGDGRRAEGQKPLVGRAAMPADVARAILRAAERRGVGTLRVSPVARAAWWLSRVAPGLYERAMCARLAGEFGV